MSGYPARDSAYVAAIPVPDRAKVIGYGITRSRGARSALATSKSAIRLPPLPKECTHHSDRGSQYPSDAYRALLVEHGLMGSISRHDNPYNNIKV